ncbi:MAG: hypothetical protein K0M50_00210 [Prolixibacteraceae bacterium]|jgi:hypothetical protein|nr:hypothetical protein [Prolixibacteraceae bacterium]
MKLNNLTRLLLLAFVIMCVAPSCVKEGPMGPAGTDGTNGTNGQDGDAGTATCLACHSGNNMAQKSAEFAMSEHSVGAIAVEYAGGRAGCAQCHSHQGFVQFTTLGIKDLAITNPSAWECSTCHSIHKTFEGTDYALRITDPVVAAVASNGAMDLKGGSNLCGTCHQSRSPEPNVASPGANFTLSVRTGPHHGPQGNVLFGNGFAEIPGSVAYPAKGTADHLTKTGGSCVGCHMATFTAKQGGHSYIPSVAKCNSCHDGADITNYNYGGVQSDVHAKLELLRDKLVELGAINKTTVDGVDTYAPADKKSVPMVQAQAVFNYFGIEEDRSLGVHNPKYVRALLVNTLEALD